MRVLLYLLDALFVLVHIIVLTTFVWVNVVGGIEFEAGDLIGLVMFVSMLVVVIWMMICFWAPARVSWPTSAEGNKLKRIYRIPFFGGWVAYIRIRKGLGFIPRREPLLSNVAQRLRKDP